MPGIKNLDKLLADKNINSSIIELDNFIAEACAYGDEVESLSEPQKLFYFNQNLEREINNGTHGFFPDLKEIRTGFVANGPGLKKGLLLPDMNIRTSAC